MITYDLKANQNDRHFCPQTKYGIVTSIESCNIDEPYSIEWSDGSYSTHPTWEIDIMRAHSNLIFNNTPVRA